MAKKLSKDRIKLGIEETKNQGNKYVIVLLTSIFGTFFSLVIIPQFLLIFAPLTIWSYLQVKKVNTRYEALKEML